MHLPQDTSLNPVKLATPSQTLDSKSGFFFTFYGVLAEPKH